MFKALRHPAIRRLWFGQALSSIGDEIYRVGLTWLAVGLIGADTGFLTAGQAAALMILSFVGGKWADRWEPLSTMVNVDLIRAGIVIIPVIISHFTTVSMPMLWIMALSLSGLGAFFDPALQSTLPRFSTSVPILRSATGLMSTTIRLARMIGPSIVGFLAGIIPTLQFFSLDAVSFLFSALCVGSIRKIVPPTQHVEESGRLKRISFYEAIISGFRSIQTQHGMLSILWIKGITGGAWNLAQNLGMALLVHEVAPGNTQAFGMLIAAYGVGNFGGALFFGNRERRKSELYMFWGYIWLGFGFFFVGVAPNLHWSMIAAAAGGFGGPMNDLAFIDMVQKKFPTGEMTRIFRLRMAVETSATLVLMLFSPLLFRVFHAGSVIAACGVVWILCGIVGLIWKPWVTTGPSVAA